MIPSSLISWPIPSGPISISRVIVVPAIVMILEIISDKAPAIRSLMNVPFGNGSSFFIFPIQINKPMDTGNDKIAAIITLPHSDIEQGIPVIYPGK